MSNKLFKIATFSGILTIQDGENNVPQIPFVKKEKIKVANLPQTIKTVGDYAFANCYNLENVTLNEGLAEIGKQAFASCAKLQSVRIPQSVTKIGATPFYNCRNLKTIYVSKSTSLDKAALCESTSATVIEY